MKIGYLITARLKSTRLKKKILLKLFDKEIIRYQIKRLKLVKDLDLIILCTSTNIEDDELENIAIEEGIKCYRGDEDDVIKRLYDASQYFNLDYILNITADCPLISFECISNIIKYYKKEKYDFIQASKMVHGLFSWGIKINALKNIIDNKKSDNTEVWLKYFTENKDFNIKDIAVSNKLIRPNYRLTIDYIEDYNFFKKLFLKMGTEIYSLSEYDIIDFLDKNQDLVKINSFRSYDYKKRWLSQSKKINEN